jgi:hypothetical protein
MNSGDGTDRFESLTLVSLEQLNSTGLGITPNLILNLICKGYEEMDN